MPPRRVPGGPRSFLTEEEKRNMPKVTKALLLRIFSYLKPYTLQFILVFAALAVASLLGLLPSIITGKIVDEALIGGNMDYLIRLLIFAFITLAASQIIGVLESYINSWISRQIIYDMKNQMYDHLQHMPHAFFTGEKQGDIITRMNSDINGVSAVVSGTLASVVSNVLTVGTTLVALFSINWQLALVGIVIVPLLILPTKKVGKKRWSLLSAAQEKNDELNQHINETLSVSGSMLVKLFTKEKEEYDRFERLNAEVTKLGVREDRAGSWFHVVMGMFMQVGPLLIYFAGGFIMISAGNSALTVGAVTAVVSLVNRLYNPVRDLLNLQVDFVRSLALFTRIFEYFDKKVDITEKPDAVCPDLTDSRISFEKVSFAYDRNIPILHDVSFDLPSGKMYAIVGSSGAGKSTLIGLIPRLYDVCGGSVKIAGVDVRDYKLSYLRQNIGVVTQDTYLFNGTVMDNLLYADSTASRERIIEACKAANIHDFIMSLPDGYDTVVGNRGLKLSGGEKQRISIARVILKDPKILILDEATSSLDSISESSIQDALVPLMQGRTSLVIAHRLSTILAADMIMVVDGGTISEKGTHDELVARDGKYRELYETQFRKVLDAAENQKNENCEKREINHID